MRCVSTRVLPEPAPARMSSGPSPCDDGLALGRVEALEEVGDALVGGELRTAPLQDRRESGGPGRQQLHSLAAPRPAQFPMHLAVVGMTCDRTRRRAGDYRRRGRQARPWTHAGRAAWRVQALIFLAAAAAFSSPAAAANSRCAHAQRGARAPEHAGRLSRPAVPRSTACAARHHLRAGAGRRATCARAARRHASDMAGARLLRPRVAGRHDDGATRPRRRLSAPRARVVARRGDRLGQRRRRRAAARSCAASWTARRIARSCWIRASGTSASASRAARRRAPGQAR